MDTLLAVKESLIRRCDDITINPQGKENWHCLYEVNISPIQLRISNRFPLKELFVAKTAFAGHFRSVLHQY